MWVVRLQQVRQASLCASEGAAQIDVHHQVVALHRRVERAARVDGAGVVDQDVDATEARDCLGHRGRDLRLVAHVEYQRQRLSASRFDLRCSGVDGAGQARIGLRRLGRYDDVGAVACGAQRNRLSDAAARAGDEECLVL